MINLIPKTLTSKVMLTVLKTKKHSPKIMFVAGVVGVAGTVVTASRATLQAQYVLADHRAQLETIDGAFAVGSPNYTENDKAKDKALLLTQTGFKLVQTYAPAVFIGAASIALLTGSHVILTRRNASLTAAYAALDKAFDAYRDRVKNSVGEEKEREIYRDVRTEKVTAIGEDGKQKQVNKKVGGGGGKYTALYGPITPEGFPNTNWQQFPELNVLALRSIERQMNDKLQINGFVFWNEVLEELDLPRTQVGQQVGWLKNSEDGDGFISFGIFEDDKVGVIYDFSTGREEEIWLDFNCQGFIMDKI